MPEFTIDRQAAKDTCKHCGKVYEVSRGSVFEDHSPLALYIAGMHGCEGNPIVALTIAIARPPGEPPSAVTLQVTPTKTQFEMRVIAPDESPWQNHTYLGRMLTREEALASPLIDLFFKLADIIVTENPEVNSFLGNG